jgi:hypothetical protein
VVHELLCERQGDTVYLREALANHEEREVHEGLHFLIFSLFEFCLIVFFVIFVSSAVDASPQETPE